MSLTAYVRYDNTGRIVPGGPIVTSVKPNVGDWVAVDDIITTTPNYKLRGFIRYIKNGNYVAGSLILQHNAPKDGNWKEVYVLKPVQSNWVFTPGQVSIFPLSSAGYTLYTGGWTQYDDGQTTENIPFAKDFWYNNIVNPTYILSTNGFFFINGTSEEVDANAQDLYLTPGGPLDDGDIQNFWHKNIGNDNKWKTSILVYCGHYEAEQTPYSYILNIYRDSQYQYIETCCKINVGGDAGPNGVTVNSSTATQVWQSDLFGSTWTYLGHGSLLGGTPISPTTTSTTTQAPIECGTFVEGNEAYPNTTPVILGSSTGIVDFHFNAYANPDRFIIEWNDDIVADTGYKSDYPEDYTYGGEFRSSFTNSLIGLVDPVSGNTYPDFSTYPDDGYPLVYGTGQGSTLFNKSLSSPSDAKVVVYAPMEGTAWDYTLDCFTTTTTTTSLPYSVALLAFAIPDDGSGVACTNASNPLLLSPIYWAPGVGVEANVTLLYTDEALTVSAASGYYSDGSVYYAVNIFGLVQVIGSCA